MPTTFRVRLVYVCKYKCLHEKYEWGIVVLNRTTV